MTLRALFIIGGDPRKSPRPAEAIRIAAGVGAWKKVQITVYLHGEAVLALNQYADEFVEEDNYVRYLPLLGESGPLYVQAEAPLLAELEEPVLKFTPISTAELAELATQHNYLLRF